MVKDRKTEIDITATLQKLANDIANYRLDFFGLERRVGEIECSYLRRAQPPPEDDELICGECGEPRPDDDRVKAGMKCGFCAYGGG